MIHAVKMLSYSIARALTSRHRWGAWSIRALGNPGVQAALSTVSVTILVDLAVVKGEKVVSVSDPSV